MRENLLCLVFWAFRAAPGQEKLPINAGYGPEPQQMLTTSVKQDCISICHTLMETCHSRYD